MSEKENAPVRVRARTRAGQEKRQGEAALSYADCTTTAASSQPGGQISTLLMEGEQNALPAADLARLAGFKNDRPLRAAIDRERARGALILASDNGYFRPACGDRGITELRRFIRRMDARCTANRLSTRSARAALRTLEKAPLDGQASFWDGDGDG